MKFTTSDDIDGYPLHLSPYYGIQKSPFYLVFPLCR